MAICSNSTYVEAYWGQPCLCMLYTVLPDKQNAYSLPAQATAFTVISVPSVRSLPSHEGLSIFATQALLLLKLNGAPNLGWICRVVCGLPAEPGQRIFS